jgi:hypothetical protein
MLRQSRTDETGPALTCECGLSELPNDEGMVSALAHVAHHNSVSVLSVKNGVMSGATDSYQSMTVVFQMNLLASNVYYDLKEQGC